MGLNIVVKTAAGTEHPKWDAVRQGPDRKIADIIKLLPSLENIDFEGDAIIRPSDFVTWRQAAPEDVEARSRYLDLVGILETEPEYWIVLSY